MKKNPSINNHQRNENQNHSKLNYYSSNDYHQKYPNQNVPVKCRKPEKPHKLNYYRHCGK